MAPVRQTRISALARSITFRTSIIDLAESDIDMKERHRTVMVAVFCPIVTSQFSSFTITRVVHITLTFRPQFGVVSASPRASEDRTCRRSCVFTLVKKGNPFATGLTLQLLTLGIPRSEGKVPYHWFLS